MCIFGDQCSLKHTRRNNIRTCFHFIFSLYFFVMSFLSRFSFHFQQFPWLLSVAFYLSSLPHPNTRGGTLVLVSACCVNEAFCYLNSTQTLKANLVCAPNRTPAMYFHEWHQHPLVPGTRRPEGVCVVSGVPSESPFCTFSSDQPLGPDLGGPHSDLPDKPEAHPTLTSFHHHLPQRDCWDSSYEALFLKKPWCPASPGPSSLTPSLDLFLPLKVIGPAVISFLPPIISFFLSGGT